MFFFMHSFDIVDGASEASGLEGSEISNLIMSNRSGEELSSAGSIFTRTNSSEELAKRKLTLDKLPSRVAGLIAAQVVRSFNHRLVIVCMYVSINIFMTVCVDGWVRLQLNQHISPPPSPWSLHGIHCAEHKKLSVCYRNSPLGCQYTNCNSIREGIKGRMPELGKSYTYVLYDFSFLLEYFMQGNGIYNTLRRWFLGIEK